MSRRDGTRHQRHLDPNQSAAPRRKLEKHDRKIDLGLHDHKTHANCPDTLACLPDTNGRPQHTLPVILRCAILGSPRKRLTIREIYAAMESKYPYYKSAGQTWKVAVFSCNPQEIFVAFVHYSNHVVAIGPPSSLIKSSVRTPATTRHGSWLWIILDGQLRSPTRDKTTPQKRTAE